MMFMRKSRESWRGGGIVLGRLQEGIGDSIWGGESKSVLFFSCFCSLTSFCFLLLEGEKVAEYNYYGRIRIRGR
jgi:hypothetical protein